MNIKKCGIILSKKLTIIHFSYSVIALKRVDENKDLEDKFDWKLSFKLYYLDGKIAFMFHTLLARSKHLTWIL